MDIGLDADIVAIHERIKVLAMPSIALLCIEIYKEIILCFKRAKLERDKARFEEDIEKVFERVDEALKHCGDEGDPVPRTDSQVHRHPRIQLSVKYNLHIMI